MFENKVVPLRQKDEIDDPLTEILRAGAKRLIEQAVEAEFAAFLGSHADLKLADGRQRIVRHGHDPVRPIQTGIGPVEVEKPKARDRGALSAEERIRYSSSILPKWARRTRSLDVLLPALYLRGISTGDFQEVLTALLGKDAPNLSPAVIARLKGEWEDEYKLWQKRDLSAHARARAKASCEAFRFARAQRLSPIRRVPEGAHNQQVSANLFDIREQNLRDTPFARKRFHYFGGNTVPFEVSRHGGRVGA